MGARDHSIECEVCGFMRGGLNDLTCACEQPYVALVHGLATLAHNLAIGAALCRAYTEGALQQAAALVALLPRLPVDAVVANRITNRWWPGCNRSAP